MKDEYLRQSCDATGDDCWCTVREHDETKEWKSGEDCWLRTRDASCSGMLAKRTAILFISRDLTSSCRTETPIRRRRTIEAAVRRRDAVADPPTSVR